MANFPLKPAATKTLGVTYKLAKLPLDPKPCVPDALRLVWFTDLSGSFSEVAEAAYLLPVGEGAAGPVLGVAGIIGETCGAQIFWTTAWTPESGSGGNPGVHEDGARLIIWPKTDTEPGILTVTARIDNKNYGPIALTVLRYICNNYCYCGPTSYALDPLVWNTGATDITDTNTWDNPGVTYTSTVTGTWPTGTTFSWDVSTLPYGFTSSTADNVLTVSYNAYASGTLTASCTANYPSGASETVGPITLTVYPY